MKELIVIFFLLIEEGLFAQNAGDNIFYSSEIHSVYIDFYDGNYWNLLTKNYESTRDKDTNIYIAAAVKIDSITLDSVGIRLKGNSSYEHPGMKKPLKLSFNEYDSLQTFDKLKQLNLNNGYLDPTMMREKLFLDFLNKKNIPAPRCTYAAVYFNGEYIGLYKMVEEADKKFLKTHFGNSKGNLYKGDPNGTLEWKGNAQWNYYNQYELKTNETENDWDDLLNFIDVLNNSPMESFKKNVNEIFNASSFIRAWAANNLFVNMDSYFFLQHNYYLYHNSNDKFEWITWDVSTVFGVFPLFSEERAEKIELLYLPVQRDKHPLTYKMLDIDDYRKEYLNSICSFVYNDFSEKNLFPKIDSIAERIRSFLQKENEKNKMYSNDDFEKNISDGTISKIWYDAPGLKSFITNRRNFAIRQLCEIKWSCVRGENISDSLNQIVNIYPNPAENEIAVDVKIVEPESKGINYKIVNLLGEIVHTEYIIATGNSFTQKISTEKLISGFYILSTETGCESYNKKIVVIK